MKFVMRMVLFVLGAALAASAASAQSELYSGVLDGGFGDVFECRVTSHSPAANVILTLKSPMGVVERGPVSRGLAEGDTASVAVGAAYVSMRSVYCEVVHSSGARIVGDLVVRRTGFPSAPPAVSPLRRGLDELEPAPASETLTQMVSLTLLTQTGETREFSCRSDGPSIVHVYYRVLDTASTATQTLSTPTSAISLLNVGPAAVSLSFATSAPVPFHLSTTNAVAGALSIQTTRDAIASCEGVLP